MGSRSPAALVTSVNVPSPLFRRRDGRMGYDTARPRQGDVDVHESVVVVIPLDAAETAELVQEAGFLRPVLEGAVSLVPV